MKQLFIFATLAFLQCESLKIFEFSSSLEDNSRVIVTNNAPTPTKFTLCMDFYSRMDPARKLLTSKGEDIEIQIGAGGYIIYILVGGIWYLAVPESPPWVDTVTWATICVSYNSEDQAVTVAFRNNIIFAETEAYEERELSDNFLRELSLGEKNKEFQFIGDITRVNIWSTIFDEEVMKNITDCGASSYKETPDILNWDEADITVEGDVIEKEVDEYPCTFANNNIHDVLMPIPAESMFEALKTCKVLGGDLNFPLTLEEVEPLLASIRPKMLQSSCKSFLWSNYFKNEYVGNNWTVYESSNTYSYPPFKYPGWMEFAAGQPNGREYETCAGISLAQGKQNLFHDLDCYKEDYCYSCRQDVAAISFITSIITSLLDLRKSPIIS